MRSTLIILAFVAALALVWAGWRYWPVSGDTPPQEAIAVTALGSPSGRNLIGVEPALHQSDYRSPAALQSRLAAYLDAARDAGAIVPGSVVIFPEHVGTWLVASGAPASAFSARTVDGAMMSLAGAHPVSFAGALIGSNEDDRLAAALFRMRSVAMARNYQSVFAGLAREYGVTLVAGSIVLADPYVEDGAVRVRQGGPLYNVTAVFGPDGSPHPQLVRKAYPIPSEAGFTASAPPDGYPLFDTPAGRLGVLVCADSWHPDVYAAVGEAELLAVPAYLQPSGVWDQPWGGYVTPWPGDVPRGDAGRLTEGEAWQTHALAGRLSSTQALAGMTAFLGGTLWDMGSDGAAIAVNGEDVHTATRTPGGQVVVLWVED
ncbi:MAG: carbon-nitrogen hydrolase family protein [Oceanicaulis sp.]|uniref:carbon-nitrogen hydrolase family protein n=1 Tax=Glycocaulis sp. TaxID=1969725 RepID=UPI0025BA4BC6|nr:carbon-nitrogen hydrolase family protein [Glycocaulis sp.]MCC5981197.1 carbon-nitrogen hydrolase family protein [Oceanicaulis sp.]MCH8521643.1 carbon-nitrogen hydrolase family protein [Glycocaulis sp.]